PVILREVRPIAPRRSSRLRLRKGPCHSEGGTTEESATSTVAAHADPSLRSCLAPLEDDDYVSLSRSYSCRSMPALVRWSSSRSALTKYGSMISRSASTASSAASVRPDLRSLGCIVLSWMPSPAQPGQTSSVPSISPVPPHSAHR